MLAEHARFSVKEGGVGVCPWGGVGVCQWGWNWGVLIGVGMGCVHGDEVGIYPWGGVGVCPWECGTLGCAHGGGVGDLGSILFLPLLSCLFVLTTSILPFSQGWMQKFQEGRTRMPQF